jgi:hypothetical protein
MQKPEIIVAERDALQEAVADVVRTVMLEDAPAALREAMKSKWLHRDEAKDRYGLTDRQLQYLRDNQKVTYTQRGRRIWYLRESLEDYFEEGRVDARDDSN